MRFIDLLISGGGAPPCRNSEKCKGEILSEDTLWPNQFLTQLLQVISWDSMGIFAYVCSISNLKLWFSLHQLCKHLRAHIACGTSYWWKLVKVQPMLVVWPVQEPAIPQKELGVGTSRFVTFPRSFHEFKQVFTCFYQNDHVVMFWIGCDCSDIPVLSIFKHSNRITQHFMAIQSCQRRQIESYGGFHTWRYRQIIHFNRIFHCKPSILGYPIYGTSHMGPSESIQVPIRHLPPRQVAGRQELGEDHGLDTLACASWGSELQHRAWHVQTWWAAIAVARQGDKATSHASEARHAPTRPSCKCWMAATHAEGKSQGKVAAGNTGLVSGTQNWSTKPESDGQMYHVVFLLEKPFRL